jgi:hypothetical protein
MAKNRYRVTDEKIELILSLRRHCNDQRTIAKAVDLSQGTVCRILEAKFIDISKKHKPSKYFNWNDFNKSII